MTTAEKLDELIKHWTGVFAPATPFEERMVLNLAQLGVLLSRSIEKSVNTWDLANMGRQLREQTTLSKMTDSTIRTLKMVQKVRIASTTPPPPKTPAKAKAKVIPFPKAPSIASVGRPRKIEIETEPSMPLDGFAPRGQSKKQRGETPSLDLKIAA